MATSDDVAIAKSVLADVEHVRSVIAKVKRIRQNLIEMCLAGSISEIEFYAISSLLSPQSRSSLWQNYYMKKHGAVKIKAEDNKGDFRLNRKYYEYKTSCNDDALLHLVQIRLWQACNYIIQSIQADEVHTFQLSHAQMKREAAVLGATSAHGTKQANKDNKNVELRITIEVGSKDWKRWVKRYLVRD